MFVGFRQPRIKNPRHLHFISGLPCLICGINTGVDAAHIRFSDRRVDKRQVGIGEKPDDIWTVPLCRACHTRQHEMNERQFWRDHGIDPILYALALVVRSGDQAGGERIVSAAKEDGLA